MVERALWIVARVANLARARAAHPQAKASSLSRGFEVRALQTAVEKMTLEIEKTKDTAPYRAATASRTREAAEKARERVEAARKRVEAARAAAEQTAPRKPTPPADDSQP